MPGYRYKAAERNGGPPTHCGHSSAQVGFVLGFSGGYGQGVFATGRARLTVADFRVE